MEKARDEKKKETLKKAFGNNFYMLKLAYQACKSRVICAFINRAMGHFSWMFATVIFLEFLMNSIEMKRDYRVVLFMIIISVVIFSVTDLIQGYCDRMIFSAGNQKLYENLHIKMFEKAIDVELECYENPEFYNRYTKAASQVKGRAFSVLNVMPDMILSSITMIWLAAKTIRIDKFAIIFALLPLFSTYYLGKKINEVDYALYKKNVASDRKAEYVRRTVYLKDYAKEIRLSNIFSVLMDYFNDAVKEMLLNIHHYGIKETLLAGTQGFFNQVVIWAGTLVYATVRLIYFKDITTGEYVILVNMINNLVYLIRDWSKMLNKVHDNSLYINNIRDFLSYTPKIAQSQDGILPKEEKLHIKLSDVSYTYLGQKTSVLKNINMEIKEKQKIALVGHNGAGKTTLVKLLMRLYDTSGGEILLNGRNIKDYQVTAYRDLFSTVFQDFKLFSLSVAENVMMKELADGDREIAEAALKDSGAYEKIQTLKNQMDTTLTKEFDPKGVILSGGEAQKIAIARVFAKDSKVAIFDEPSSALDPIAEYKLYDAMLRACKDKAVIFISHRLSSAVLADQVYMMENGQIIEAGSHEELMKLNGKYAQMFQMQAKNYV